MGSRWKIMTGAGSALVVWTTVWSAAAQSASPYTMPVTAPEEPHVARPEGPGAVQVPHHSQSDQGEENISLPPPVPSNPLQQMLQEKKSWAEMTPEEILGIAPAKKATDPKTVGLERKDSAHSPLRDFLLQQRLAPTGKKAIFEDDSEDLGTLGRSQATMDQQRLETMPAGARGGTQMFSKLLETARGTITHEFSDSDWAGVFMTPPPPTPTPAQQADMESFRQMLLPDSPTTDSRSAQGGKPLASLPAVDPNLEPARPGYNPAGGSFLPLDSGVNRPKRLDALPTATGSGYQAPYTTPSWAPKPPPWTLQTPQLFVEPQRKF